MAVAIDYHLTRVFNETLDAWLNNKRRLLHEGGTSSSKTYSILQFLIQLAEKTKEPLLISIVSETLPHLRKGCIRQFFEILGEIQDNNKGWSKTQFTYKRPNWKGSFEFFGADDEGAARGPRRQVLFINEGNNVRWDVARNLDSRTDMFTIVDWNPSSVFWAHEFWQDLASTHYVHSTYKDALSAGVISQEFVNEAIEIYRDKDPNWYNVFGLGLLGKIEGLVYPFFEQVEELPLGEYFYGLDYGYLVDPTVLVKNVIVGSNLYSEQMFYDTSGLDNGQIAQKMTLLGIRNEPIYPDPDEPKSSDEIAKKGFRVQEVVKGKGSVAFGIQRVNQFYQFWVKESIECIKEQRNHRFIKRRDATGTEYLSNDTTHQWSHGLDGRRYAVSSHKVGLRGKDPLAVSNITGRYRDSRAVSNQRGR